MAKLSTDAELNGVRLKEQGSNPASPASGYGQFFCKSDGLYYKNAAGAVTGPLGAGGGGAPTTTPYVTTAADAGLSAEVAIPGLAGSADRLGLINGAAAAGISEEYDTATPGLTWTSAPTATDSNTTLKSHLYAKYTVGGAGEILGYRTWAPAGGAAFDAQCRMAAVSQSNGSGAGLYIANSDRSLAALLNIAWVGSNTLYAINAFTYASSTWTQRSSAFWAAPSGAAYLRIKRDGSNNLSFWASESGPFWNLIVTYSFTFTVANIGYRMGTAGADTVYLMSDWLRTDV